MRLAQVLVNGVYDHAGARMLRLRDAQPKNILMIQTQMGYDM